MKNRRQTTNGNFKFKGTLEKFNSLLDVVELNRHEFLSEKNSYGLEDLVADQPSRKKRSLRQQPKKNIDAEVLQNRELVLLGSDLDWFVMVVKEKEMLQSQTQEKSSSGLEDEKAKKPPELIIIDDQPPRKKRSLRRQPKKMIIDAEVLQKRELVLPGSDVDWVVMVVKDKEMTRSQTQEKSSSGEAVRLRPEILDLNLPPDEISNLNWPPSHSGTDDMMIDNCD